MIDDKKIETVANEYSQDNCGYSYNINKLLAFKAGAKQVCCIRPAYIRSNKLCYN